MHRLQRFANTKHELHQLLFRELGVVDQIRIDHILQIPPPIVREQYIHRLRAGIIFVARDAVVDTGYDVRMWNEELVRLDFLERMLHGFLAERTPDLFQCVESVCGSIFDEVDV
jgi:hypothetical protein